MEKTLQFRLGDFEGPLDLLLALIQKNQKSVYEVEIHLLIEQYLEVVGTLRPEDMDRAADFIAMTARLVMMKSALLLPRSEEGERMREELVGQLIEYEACKRVADGLREMAKGVCIVARRPLSIPLDAAYRGRHQPTELAAAFALVLGRRDTRRAPRAEQFDEIVTAPIVSVAGRIIYLLRGLKNGGITKLRQSFAACRGRGETVATFLALLELIRGGRVEIDTREQLRLTGRGGRRSRAAHIAPAEVPSGA
jgi:segregation and condensation protein A